MKQEIKSNIRGMFLARHADKGNGAMSQKHLGISDQGEREVRQYATRLQQMIEQSPQNAVFFLGACSEHQRTDATALAYMDKVSRGYNGREDVVVYVPKAIERWQQEKAQAKLPNMSTSIPYNNKGVSNLTLREIRDTIKETRKVIKDNPDKKVIVCLPLYLKDFSFFRHGWINPQTYDFNDYAKKILEGRVELPEQEQYGHLTRRWLETQGRLDSFKGPNPQDCMGDFEKGVGRYKRFASRFAGGRPTYTGTFNHAWEADAYATKEATEKLTPEAFDEVFGKKALATAEPVTILSNGTTKTVSVRNREWGRK